MLIFYEKTLGELWGVHPSIPSLRPYLRKECLDSKNVTTPSTVAWWLVEICPAHFAEVSILLTGGLAFVRGGVF
jgi:hypothetical protein